MNRHTWEETIQHKLENIQRNDLDMDEETDIIGEGATAGIYLLLNQT